MKGRWFFSADCAQAVLCAQARKQQVFSGAKATQQNHFGFLDICWLCKNKKQNQQRREMQGNAQIHHLILNCRCEIASVSRRRMTLLTHRRNCIKQHLKAPKTKTWPKERSQEKEGGKKSVHVICLNKPVMAFFFFLNCPSTSPPQCFMGQAFKHSLLSSQTSLNTHGLFI